VTVPSVEILARTSWMSDATSATVCFGEQVTAVTRPGHVPTHVRQFHANDDTEPFCQALDALDGALGLSRSGDGARLLVVVSDSYYTPSSSWPAGHGCGACWPQAAGCCGSPFARTPSPWREPRWRSWTTQRQRGAVIGSGLYTPRHDPIQPTRRLAPTPQPASPTRVPRFVATWSWPEGDCRWSGTRGMRLEALRT